jgi:hypothetical protein
MSDWTTSTVNLGSTVSMTEKFWEYIQRDKERTDRDGNPIIRGMPLQQQIVGPGEFNVFSITDCTVYEVSAWIWTCNK